MYQSTGNRKIGSTMLALMLVCAMTSVLHARNIMVGLALQNVHCERITEGDIGPINDEDEVYILYSARKSTGKEYSGRIPENSHHSMKVGDKWHNNLIKGVELREGESITYMLGVWDEDDNVPTRELGVAATIAGLLLESETLVKLGKYLYKKKEIEVKDDLLVEFKVRISNVNGRHHVRWSWPNDNRAFDQTGEFPRYLTDTPPNFNYTSPVSGFIFKPGSEKDFEYGIYAFVYSRPNLRRFSTYLAHMTPTDTCNVHGGLPKAGLAYDGSKIKIGGSFYSKGLGTHAPSNGSGKVSYYLGGKYTTFETTVGWTPMKSGGECADDGMSMEFYVLGDGKRMAGPYVVGSKNKEHNFSLDVNGVRTLTLKVTPKGDGNSCDHGSWGNPVVSGWR